jgi:hypothetical protein
VDCKDKREQQKQALNWSNFSLQSDPMPTTTVSISEAKKRLGQIADRAIEGDHIVIVRKSKLLVLKPLEVPEPVPMRPPGYFHDCYDEDAIKESNELAARSVRKIVK